MEMKNGNNFSWLTPEGESLIQDAIDVIARDRRATTGYIQRRLGISCDMAASIVEVLEQRGIVGPQVGACPRKILLV